MEKGARYEQPPVKEVDYLSRKYKKRLVIIEEYDGTFSICGLSFYIANAESLLLYNGL